MGKKLNWISVYNHITLLNLTLQALSKILLVSFSFIIYSLPAPIVLLFGMFNSAWLLLSVAMLVFFAIKRDARHIGVPAIFCGLAVLEAILMFLFVSNAVFIILDVLPSIIGVVFVYKITKQESNGSMKILRSFFRMMTEE